MQLFCECISERTDWGLKMIITDYAIQAFFPICIVSLQVNNLEKVSLKTVDENSVVAHFSGIEKLGDFFLIGSIHLRRRQIFTIFDPYPPTIGIPAKCL